MVTARTAIVPTKKEPPTMSLSTSLASSRDAGYDAWFAKVDAIIVKRSGLRAADLPDFGYLDAFEDGTSPAATAGRVIRAARDY